MGASTRSRCSLADASSYSNLGEELVQPQVAAPQNLHLKLQVATLCKSHPLRSKPHSIAQYNTHKTACHCTTHREICLPRCPVDLPALSVCLPACACACMSVPRSACLSVYLCASVCVCVCVCVYVCMCTCLPACPSACWSSNLSVCRCKRVCLPAYLCAYLSLCLPACQCICMPLCVRVRVRACLPARLRAGRPICCLPV